MSGELSTRTTSEVVASEEISLDEHADLVKLDRFLTEKIKELGKEQAAVRARLQELIGDHTIATLNGEPVYRWEPTEQFRESDFKKAYPSMWKACLREETVEKLAKDILKATWPDIYREFQSRPFKTV